MRVATDQGAVVVNARSPLEIEPGARHVEPREHPLYGAGQFGACSAPRSVEPGGRLVKIDKGRGGVRASIAQAILDLLEALSFRQQLGTVFEHPLQWLAVLEHELVEAMETVFDRIELGWIGVHIGGHRPDLADQLLDQNPRFRQAGVGVGQAQSETDHLVDLALRPCQPIDNGSVVVTEICDDRLDQLAQPGCVPQHLPSRRQMLMFVGGGIHRFDFGELEGYDVKSIATGGARSLQRGEIIGCRAPSGVPIGHLGDELTVPCCEIDHVPLYGRVRKAVLFVLSVDRQQKGCEALQRGDRHRDVVDPAPPATGRRQLTSDHQLLVSRHPDLVENVTESVATSHTEPTRDAEAFVSRANQLGQRAPSRQQLHRRHEQALPGPGFTRQCNETRRHLDLHDVDDAEPTDLETLEHEDASYHRLSPQIEYHGKRQGVPGKRRNSGMMNDHIGDTPSIERRSTAVTLSDDLAGLLAMAADHAHVGVVITDEGWGIIHASRGFLEMVGVESPEVVGQNILAILDENIERPWVAEAVERLESTGQWHSRLQETTRWGLTLTLDISATQFFDGENRFLGNTIVFVDVSREEELERQLRMAQRLDSIGQLAGGIAHNFNNLLQTMENSAHLLLGAISDNDQAARHLRLIRNTLKDGRQLVRQLLALGRQETMEPEPVRLGDLVMELAPMLRRTIPEFIHLNLDVPGGSDDPIVEVDTSAIQQVLLNLVINARDAMPQGGTVTIRVGSGHSAQHAALAVEDTGTGIPFEHLERIFEPFYTTKGQQGTGLGLATVEGIVAQCGGSISVETSPDQGTTFTVELPRARDVEPKTAAEVLRGIDGETKTPSTRGRLLLVEDDTGVRESLAEILDAYGFEIRTATSGGEALSVLDDEPTWQPQFLITDLMMPGISGQELARRLCQRLPDLRVILASGYHPDSLPDLGHIAYLRKPFRIPLLLETIDQLHARSGPGESAHGTQRKETS